MFRLIELLLGRRIRFDRINPLLAAALLGAALAGQTGAMRELSKMAIRGEKVVVAIDLGDPSAPQYPVVMADASGFGYWMSR